MEAFGANSEDVSIRWSNHLDLQRGWSRRRRFLRRVLDDPLEKGRAT